MGDIFSDAYDPGDPGWPTVAEPVPTKFKDKSGLVINVGDLIVYGHALGRCAGLQYGKVLGMAKTRLAVQGVDDHWKGHAPKLNVRKGAVAYGERTLVITREQVPPAILKLLDTVQP